MDSITPAERSLNMSRVRGKNTKPEMIVRKLVFSLGYRYRLHRTDLPGKPDLVFPGLHKAILVHGCFWHRHACPAGNRMPKSRVDFWQKKLSGNKIRDQLNLRKMRRHGWSVLVLWECELKCLEKLSRKIKKFLQSPVRHT